MKEDIQPKKRSEKIIISISDETSEWLELYCKTNGIFRKDTDEKRCYTGKAKLSVSGLEPGTGGKPHEPSDQPVRKKD